MKPKIYIAGKITGDLNYKKKFAKAEKGIQDFKAVSDLFSSGLSRRAISEKTGIAYATVSRMLQSGYKPFKTEARYFSETQRSAEWFNQI